MFLLLRDIKWNRVIGVSSWVSPEPMGYTFMTPFAPLRYHFDRLQNHTYQFLHRSCGTGIAAMAWLLSVWELGMVWGEETRAVNMVTSVVRRQFLAKNDTNGSRFTVTAKF